MLPAPAYTGSHSRHLVKGEPVIDPALIDAAPNGRRSSAMSRIRTWTGSKRHDKKQAPDPEDLPPGLKKRNPFLACFHPSTVGEDDYEWEDIANLPSSSIYIPRDYLQHRLMERSKRAPGQEDDEEDEEDEEPLPVVHRSRSRRSKRSSRARAAAAAAAAPAEPRDPSDSSAGTSQAFPAAELQPNQ